MTLVAATRHTEATRKAIVEAAAELFLDRRRGGVSVQEVADRAGLTHRTVYRYFPTRQELMGATAQYLAPGFADDPFGDVSTVEDAAREHPNAAGPHIYLGRMSREDGDFIAAARYVSSRAASIRVALSTSLARMLS